MSGRLTKRLEIFLQGIPKEMRADPKMLKFIRIVWMAGAASCQELIMMEIADLSEHEGETALTELVHELQDFADDERAKFFGGENTINQ